MTDASTDPAGRSTIPPSDDREQTGAIATVAQQASSEAGQLAHDAGHEVRAVAGAAQRQASTFASSARDQFGREADDVAVRAANALSATATDLTAMADGNGSPDAPAATVVREIGDRVERVAEQLHDRGYQGIVDDVSRWARNHPGTFLLAAAGTGFALGRLFRSVDTGAVVDAAKEGAGMGPGGDPGELPSGTLPPSPVRSDLSPEDLAAGTDVPVGAVAGVPPGAFEPGPIDLTEDAEPSTGPRSTTGSPDLGARR